MTTLRHYTRAEMAQVYDNVLGELLPGRSVQSVTELSTVQRYEIGSRLQLGQKVFHYALVGVGALGLVAGWAAKVRNQQDIGFGAIPATGARVIGDRNLLLPIGAADGPAQDGSFPVDYLRGGTVTVRPAGFTFNVGITRHPVKAAGAGTLLVQLDSPIPVDVAVTNQVEAIASIYANVVQDQDAIPVVNWQAVVGMPMLVAPAGSFVWLQTWGPIAAIGALTVGAAVDQRAVYANANSALDVFATDGGIGQYIGYVMASGNAAGAQGAPFVFLQLDP
ncbi:hypothetical protein LCGC14_3022860 [marine sediment metagenome]|uniref:Uncharacterized protein n=1 Tax=marine sediment metagenome TaxID=412755 RepID=A0A0F8WV73_9ZZZZ